MASNVRRALESWLQKIPVKGSVLDIGGVFMPIKGRTKTWEVTNYRILDQVTGRGSIKADYVVDINRPFNLNEQFDVIFCIEVITHVYDPMQVFKNISKHLKKGGTLYLSTHFVFPHHSGFDCLRYTRNALTKLCEVNGLCDIKITPRLSTNGKLLSEYFMSESKVVKYGEEIGYLVSATK